MGWRSRLYFSSMDLDLLRLRADLFRRIRSFFDERDYLEVDTPILAPALIPETCLEVFETSYLAPTGTRSRPASVPYWLVPSPEVWMKRLIADHGVSVYQLSRCFRNGESTGRLHSPEFVMLEYYSVGFDYRDSLALTEEFFSAVLGRDAAADLRPPFLRLSMDEAFRRWGAVDLERVERAHRDWTAAGGQGSGRRDEGAFILEARARELSLDPPPDLPVERLYDLLFVHAVEPSLPGDRPVALMDYPAFVPCLAKDRPGSLAKERWELYGRGIELANCYTEETDPDEVRRYFEAEAAEKSSCALVPHGIDDEYWRLFSPRGTGPDEVPFPACSGVAMGVDRLLMLAAGRSTIDSVLPFPMG